MTILDFPKNYSFSYWIIKQLIKIYSNIIYIQDPLPAGQATSFNCLVFFHPVFITCKIKNKMYEVPVCSEQQMDYFSRPQNLLELRSNLSILINQDKQGVQSFLSQLATHPLFTFDSSTSLHEEVLALIAQQTKAKSSNFSSLAHFTIKMIDYICQQQAKYYHQMQLYQLDAQRMQDKIDELNSKNTMIESDVEVFKQQLEDARHELDEIVDEKGDGLKEEQEMVKIYREQKIEALEEELERMKTQLCFYRTSGSFMNSPQRTLQGEHTKSLMHLGQLNIDKSKSKIVEGLEQSEGISRYVEINRQLEIQNQKLKREINDIRRSSIRLKNEDNENILSKMNLISDSSRKLLRVRTSSKCFIEDQTKPFFDFTQFFKIFRNKREQRLGEITHNESLTINDHNQPQSQPLEQQNYEYRHLSSEWSKDSLHLPPINNPELIYLTQQSQQQRYERENEKMDWFLCQPTNIQNKSTQSSLKDIGDSMSISINTSRSYSSIGINTLRETAQALEKAQKKNEETHLGNMFKKVINSSFVSSIADFVVNKRVKKRSQKANSGVLKI